MANRLYSTDRWQRIRRAHLSEHPLCEICKSMGLITTATIVDHIEPHKGDESKFYDTSNLQSMCKQCHDSWKRRVEKSGRAFGCDVHGMPIDPRHPWGRGVKSLATSGTGP